MSGPPATPPVPAGRHPLLGEIIGCPIRIASAPGLRPLPFEGTIVDESLHTLLVRRPGAPRPRRVAKRGLAGTIVVDGDDTPLVGDALRGRPEDRTKLLALGGRRRGR